MLLFQTMMVLVLLITGLGAAFLGSVKVPLAERLRIDEARVGGLVSIFGFTMIPVIFLAGFLTDLAGKQAVLVSGAVVFAAGLGVLALARTYLPALGGVILLSAGWALMINAGNVLVPTAFPGDLKYSTNLANVFFGLGAFLTPLLVAFLVARGSFALALWLIALAALVPGLLALGVDFGAILAGPVDHTPTPTETGFSRLLGDSTMWLCGLALFFYAPLEASVGAWATTYLRDQGVAERPASAILSGFWLAFMAARLVTALWLSAYPGKALILGLALASVLVLLMLVLARDRSVAMAAVIGAGLIFGPIFPTLLAVLFGHFEASLHGRAVGMLFAIGGLGWTAVPMLIGAYAQRTSVQRGFWFAVGSAVGLSIVAGLLLAV